jgi:hypothetical protein
MYKTKLSLPAYERNLYIEGEYSAKASNFYSSTGGSGYIENHCNKKLLLPLVF